MLYRYLWAANSDQNAAFKYANLVISIYKDSIGQEERIGRLDAILEEMLGKNWTVEERHLLSTLNRLFNADKKLYSLEKENANLDQMLARLQQEMADLQSKKNSISADQE